MKFLFSILIISFYVYLLERNNDSLINPFAVSAMFSIVYFYIAMIIFHYADFKRRHGLKYFMELVLILAVVHFYGTRMYIDAISPYTCLVALLHITFIVKNLKGITEGCALVPNISTYIAGVFGEYPIKNIDTLKKVKPLFLILYLIPLASLIIWI